MSANAQGEPSFRQSVDLMFNRAVALMDLSPGLEEKIRVCNSTYTVRFGVRLRGKIETFTGYRSVHSEHMEPVKGGIRYAMSVNQDEVEALRVSVDRAAHRGPVPRDARAAGPARREAVPEHPLPAPRRLDLLIEGCALEEGEGVPARVRDAVGIGVVHAERSEEGSSRRGRAGDRRGAAVAAGGASGAGAGGHAAPAVLFGAGRDGGAVGLAAFALRLAIPELGTYSSRPSHRRHQAAR